MSNADEYAADTDPGNTSSYLHISGVGVEDGKPYIAWIGGTGCVQYLEWTDPLTNAWQVIRTSAPPTPTTNTGVHIENSNLRGFYRIRVTR